MSVVGRQGNERGIRQCTCVPSFAGKHRDEECCSVKTGVYVGVGGWGRCRNLLWRQIWLFLSSGKGGALQKREKTQQKQCLYIYPCTYFYIKTRLYVSSPALNAVSLLPLCFFSSLLLSCTTCSYSVSSSMHWLRLRVSGRRTLSSDSQFSVSWSTCGGPEGAKRRCHGEDKAVLKGEAQK